MRRPLRSARRAVIPPGSSCLRRARRARAPPLLPPFGVIIQALGAYLLELLSNGEALREEADARRMVEIFLSGKAKELHDARKSILAKHGKGGPASRQGSSANANGAGPPNEGDEGRTWYLSFSD